MQYKSNTGFWRGFGSALNLFRPNLGAITADYAGRDIFAVSAEQALHRDWVAIGNDYRSSLARCISNEQSNPGSNPERDLAAS